jgi:hypothetical protein
LGSTDRVEGGLGIHWKEQPCQCQPTAGFTKVLGRKVVQANL